MKTFDIVVAADLKLGIGKDGRLPWKLSADLRYFKEITTGNGQLQNAVIMGRKTWESIPDNRRPLPKRLNVVLTHVGNYAVPDEVLIAPSLDKALELLEKMPIEKCFVIGGGQVYAEALHHRQCNLLYLTQVRSAFDCDTVFPEFENDFTLISASEAYNENGIEYCFKVFQRNLKS